MDVKYASNMVFITHIVEAGISVTSGARPIWPAVRAGLMGVPILSALLLIPAGLVPGGTWFWPHGLAFVAAYVAVNTLGNLALAVWRPAHFEVRQQSVVAAQISSSP